MTGGLVVHLLARSRTGRHLQDAWRYKHCIQLSEREACLYSRRHALLSFMWPASRPPNLRPVACRRKS